MPDVLVPDVLVPDDRAPGPVPEDRGPEDRAPPVRGPLAGPRDPPGPDDLVPDERGPPERDPPEDPPDGAREPEREPWEPALRRGGRASSSESGRRRGGRSLAGVGIRTSSTASTARTRVATLPDAARRPAWPTGRENGEGEALSRLPFEKSGGVLLSQGRTSQVPSALEGLTSVFGMGTGVTPPLWPPKSVVN